MLDDGCARIGISASPAWNGQSAICDHYGALYQHEFRRDDNGLVLIDQSQLDNLRSKLSHKFERMDTACRSGRRTLFIRMGGHALPPVAWPYLRDDTVLRGADMSRLWGAIRRRYPALDFHILQVTIDETTTVEEKSWPAGVSHAVLAWPLHHPAQWDGEAPAWVSMLESAGLRIRAAAASENAAAGVS